MSNLLRFPAETSHVSEFIREELTARGWSRDYLALRMAMSAEEFKAECQVCRGSLDFLMDLREVDLVVGEESDRKMCDAFGVSRGFFTRIHEVWRESEKRKTPGPSVEAR